MLTSSCDTDFITEILWQNLIESRFIPELEATARSYKLPLLALACNKLTKGHAAPFFFQNKQALKAAVLKSNPLAAKKAAAAASSGEAPQQPPPRFLADDLSALLTPLRTGQISTEDATFAVLELGSNKIISAIEDPGSRFLIIPEWVLVDRSEYFAALLRSGLREAHEDTIRISEFSFECIWQVMHFLCTDRLHEGNMSVSVALELISAASFFALHKLRRLAENYAVTEATVQTIDESIILQLAQFAVDSASQKLAERCAEWFQANPNAMILLAQKSPQAFFSAMSMESIESILGKVPKDVANITLRNIKIIQSNLQQN